MRINHVLIDYENVQVPSLEKLSPQQFDVHVFLGPTNSKLPVGLVVAMQRLGERGHYVQLETAGPNALDFHIAFYLGQLTLGDPQGFYHIISRDTGYDPLVRHLKSRKILAARSASIDQMPCFLPGAKEAVPSPAAGSEPKSGVGPQKADPMTLVVTDLRRRGNARPRTRKTLLNTMQACLGADMTQTGTSNLLQLLVTPGWITLGENGYVTYRLPEPAELAKSGWVIGLQ